MAKLINGSGNPAVYANEDSDLIASLTGNVTSIAAVGSEYAATQEDANTIGLADGVIITKEGRRIQLDEGGTDLFTIPTGSAGTTSYYIIGYKLTTDTESKQVCETFVQKMNSSSETITEDTFKGGATDVYVSVYRVVQNGLNIDSINLLLPKMSNINQLNSDLMSISNWEQLGNTFTYTPATTGQILVGQHIVDNIPPNIRRLGVSVFQSGDVETFVELGFGHVSNVVEYNGSNYLIAWSKMGYVNLSYAKFVTIGELTAKVYIVR